MAWHRRDVLKLTGGALAGGMLARVGRAAEPAPASATATTGGFVMGHQLVAPVGMQVLADGGNAVDAAVRFDPVPGHPNAPGPGKRPLHNMCPTVVLKNDRPVLAVGAAGFRRIPNAVFEVLARRVGRNASLEYAVAAPRLGVEAGTAVTLEAAAPQADTALLERLGYTVEAAPAAFVNAVGVDPATGAWRGAAR